MVTASNTDESGQSIKTTKNQVIVSLTIEEWKVWDFMEGEGGGWGGRGRRVGWEEEGGWGGRGEEKKEERGKEGREEREKEDEEQGKGSISTHRE